MPLRSKKAKAQSSSNIPSSKANSARGTKRKASTQVCDPSLKQSTLPHFLHSKTPAHQEAMNQCVNAGPHKECFCDRCRGVCPLTQIQYPPPCKFTCSTMSSIANRVKPPQFRLSHSYPSALKRPDNQPFQLRIPCYNRLAPPTGGRTHRPPLVNIAWADVQELWDLMCSKDAEYRRDPDMMIRHPGLMPKMRTILFDWLAEVSEVYKLHRETFHLTMDLIDRYLSQSFNAPKAKLQLLGITAMFIAAKLEEIYPPKCEDFAYVTDGACTGEDIRNMEMIFLKTIQYSLTPITTVHWLTMFLQVHHNMCNTANPQDMIKPMYQRQIMMQLALLVDLSLMDIGSTKFSYGILAASAIWLMLNPQHAALEVSGFTLGDIAPCVEWMQPFCKAVEDWLDTHPLHMKNFEGVHSDNLHNIQTHEFDTKLFERSQEIRQEIMKARRLSPQTVMEIYPTPPQSLERPYQSSSFSPFLSLS